VSWLPSGRQVAVQRQSRDQHSLTLLAVDIDTGKRRALLSEQADTFVCTCTAWTGVSRAS
jgi:hypothetical protein